MRAPLYILFAIVVAAQGFFAFDSRYTQAAWANVPPVPSERGLSGFALGDRQLAYRTTALMLQNLGDTGGRTTALKDYDFNALGKWFFLSDKMDPRADAVPYLAAYYFGGTQDATELGPVIDYLAAIGRRPSVDKAGQGWRWLAQAVYLARFRQGDFNRALDLSRELSDLWEPGRPGWMRQMPALVLNASGDKAAAYDLMLAILKEDADKLDPHEVNAMRAYVCERLLTADQARRNPLCARIP